MSTRIQNFYASLALVAISSITIFSSCQKDEVASTANEMTDVQKIDMVKQTLMATKVFDNTLSLVMKSMTKVGGLKNDEELVTRTAACSAPTIAPLDLFTFPKTVTYNFGEGCKDADGRIKTGALTLKINQLSGTGAVTEVTFNNYSDEGNKLNGTFIITNNGTLGALNMEIVAENVTMTDNNGKLVKYSFRQTIRQVSGLGNLNLTDDVYEATNTMTGVMADGMVVNWRSTTPLKKTNVCNWVQKGMGAMTLNGIIPATVDFGNDVCDNQATVTIGISSYTIDL